jgi:phasin family protein
MSIHAIEDATTQATTQTAAATEQFAAKLREMMEKQMAGMSEMTEFAKGNVEALVASAKAATAGAEVIATAVAEHGKKRFEDTSAAMRAMASAKTPQELMQLQSDFAKGTFDAGVAMFSKLTETMLKVSGEVSQPISNRAALATEQAKTLFSRAA